MASHLVSQHQLSSYATPINGAAGDATVVLGNDNTTVTGYNSHDADATIHVQDSSAAVFGATPAGTQGRKWMTNDAGAVYLYYDNGSAWVEANYLRNTGGTVSGNVIVTGTLAVTGVSTFTGRTTHNGGATIASGQSLILTGATVTGLTAASVGAGTFPAGAFVFAGAVSGITTLAMTGALSGLTTIVASSTIKGSAIRSTGGHTANGLSIVVSDSTNVGGIFSDAAWQGSGTSTTLAVAAYTGNAINFYTNGGASAGMTLSTGNVLTIASGLTVSAGTTAVQALTATTGLFTGVVTVSAATAVSLGAVAGAQRIQYDATGSGTMSFLNSANSAANIAALAGAFTAGISATTGTFSDNVTVATTKKLALNAGATTYRTESSTGIVKEFLNSVQFSQTGGTGTVSVPDTTNTTMVDLSTVLPTAGGSQVMILVTGTVSGSEGSALIIAARNGAGYTMANIHLSGRITATNLSTSNVQIFQNSGVTANFTYRLFVLGVA